MKIARGEEAPPSASSRTTALQVVREQLACYHGENGRKSVGPLQACRSSLAPACAHVNATRTCVRLVAAVVEDDDLVAVGRVVQLGDNLPSKFVPNPWPGPLNRTIGGLVGTRSRRAGCAAFGAAIPRVAFSD